MTRPAQTDIQRTRRLLLFLPLGLLTISHWNPQGAYPLHAVAVSLGFLCTLAGTGLLWIVGNGKVSVRIETAVAVGAMVLFAGWWMFRQYGAPVPALGRDHTGRVLQGTVLFLSVAGILLSTQDLDERSALRRMVMIWLAGFGCVCALHAVYQTFGPAGLPGTFRSQVESLMANREYYATGEFEGLLHALEERRAAGRLGSPNVFAGFMALALPVAMGLTVSARRNTHRLAWGASAFLMITAVLLSGSRGALVAVVFATGVFVLLLSGRKLLLRKSAIAAVFALLICGASGGEEEKSGFERRWLGISTLQQRAYYWDAGLSMWSESLLVGKGPGAYEVLYASHRVADSQETRLAHNWFVEFGAATGLIGVCLFLLLIGSAVYSCGRNIRDSGEDGIHNAALLAALLTAVVHGLVEFTLQYTEVWLDCCLLVALCVSFSTGLTTRTLPPRLIGILLIVPAILAIPAWWLLITRPMLAEWHATMGEYAMADKDFGSAYDSLSRAVSWQPDNPDLHHTLGETQWRLGQSPLDEFARARELNPWSARTVESLAIWTWRGGGDIDSAIEQQREAVDLHPLDAHHTMQLARMLLEAGKHQEARSLAERARNVRRNYAEDVELAELERLVGDKSQ